MEEGLTSRQAQILYDGLSSAGCTPVSDLALSGLLITPSSMLLSTFLTTLQSIGRRKKRRLTVVTGLRMSTTSTIGSNRKAGLPPNSLDAMRVILNEFKSSSSPSTEVPVPTLKELAALCDGVVDVVSVEWMFATLNACSAVPLASYLLPSSVQQQQQQPQQQRGNDHTSPLPLHPTLSASSHSQPTSPPPVPSPKQTSVHTWWNPPCFLVAHISKNDTTDEPPNPSPFRDFAVYRDSQPSPQGGGFQQQQHASRPTGGFFPVFFGNQQGGETEPNPPSSSAVQSVFMTDRMKRQLDYIDRKQVFAVQKAVPDNNDEKGYDDNNNARTGNDCDPPSMCIAPYSAPESRIEKDATGKLNEDIVDELAKLKSVYEATGDQWRKYAYNRAIGIIKRWPTRIQSAADLRHCQGLGDKLLNKIDEIIKSGTTNKLSYLRGQSFIQASEQLVTVWGISSATAKRISTIPYERLERTLRSMQPHHSVGIPPQREYAYTSVDDVRRWPPAFLNPQQRVGLKFFEDLLVRIPRAEVEVIRGSVMGALRRLGVRVNPNTEATMRGVQVGEGDGGDGSQGVDLLVCGSYRRGKTSSGDVDVLICDRSGRHCDGLLKLLVEEMRKGVVVPPTTTLSSSSSPTTKDDDHKEDSKSYTDATANVGTANREKFVIGELTVSYKSSHETSADTWFGLVQVPPCSSGATCACGHRGSGTATVDNSTEGKGRSGGAETDTKVSSDVRFPEFKTDATTPVHPPPPHSFEARQATMPSLGFKRSRSPSQETGAASNKWVTDPNNAHGDDVTVFKSLNGGAKTEVDDNGSDIECLGEASPLSDHIGISPESIHPYQEGPHYARRLDIKVYSAEHFPFAVLYFTGSDYFNRSMRLYAQKRGMSLSDKTLMHVVRATTGKRDKIHEGCSEVCTTEREIFDRLGLPYRRPHERDL